MNRTMGTCFVMLVLFLLAMGLTVAVYLSMIVPQYRNQAFWVAVVGSCVAEFVFFGYLLYAMLVPASPGTPDTATRGRTTSIAGVWIIVILVTGAIAVAPKYADSFYSDKLLGIQLAVSFLLFLVAFFQHRQSVAVQIRDEPVQQERVRLEAYAGGVDVLLAEMRQAAERFPDQAVEFDQLQRRIDTLKTQLSASTGTTERDAGRPAAVIPIEQIEQALRDLKQAVERLGEASGETVAAVLTDARKTADRASALLKRRADVLTF